MASIADSGNYAARATAIRETAKWIAAIFAGAGAVLFSGLSFANVAQAASTERWWLPVLLAALPVLAAAWAVREAAEVITAEPPETRALIGGLGPAQGLDEPVRRAVETLRPAVVETYGTLDKFEERLRRARDAVDEARDLYSRQPLVSERLAELERAYRELDALQEGVRDVVLAADYVRVKARYANARRRLALAASVATVSAAATGVLVGQAQRDEATVVERSRAPRAVPLRFTAPTPVRVVLTYPPSRKRSAPCPFSNGETALAIGGTYVRPLLLFHRSGSTRRGPARCLRAWRWAPNRAEVVVVPMRVERLK